MSLVVLLKVTAAVLPMLAVQARGSASTRRIVRRLAWIEAWLLTGYGLFYTFGGLLVQADVLHTSPDADQRALAWHTYFWDPWFLVWGILALIAMLYSRASISNASDHPPGLRTG